MRVVEKSVSRRRSSPSSKWTRSDIVETMAFVDEQRESSGGTVKATEVEGEENLRTAWVQRSSKQIPKGMLAVRRTGGKRGRKRVKHLVRRAEMEAKEGGKSYFSRKKVCRN